MINEAKKIYRIEARIVLKGWEIAEAAEYSFTEACKAASNILSKPEVIQVRFAPLGAAIAYGTYIPQFLD